jgi:DNA-binding MarR family transcriptional regulator
MSKAGSTSGVLQAELRKKRPFDVAEEEAFLNLQRTLDALAAPFEQLFRQRGISDSQYNVLRILRGVGGDGLPCTEIAERMVSRDPDITRLVDRLETAGLVVRVRIARDRRVILVRITAVGQKLVGDLDQPVTELHRRQLGHLKSAELDLLNKLLVKARYPNGIPAGAGITSNP